MARPTRYKKEFADQARKLCLLGATDSELADFFLVTEQTVNNWKKAHKEFFESVTHAKTLADAEVAESFHKRAVGYRYEETHYEANQAGKMKKTKRIEKEIPPDAGAALNWLKNRQKDKWRDKQVIEQNSRVTHNIMPVPSCTDVDDWEKAAKQQQDEALND